MVFVFLKLNLIPSLFLNVCVQQIKDMMMMGLERLKLWIGT